MERTGVKCLTLRHRPDAVRILDFPHVGEHINNLLEALEQAKVHFPEHLLERCLHILKHRGPRPLLRMADRMAHDIARQKEVNTHLEYLRKREELMQYPRFRREGWPIGSGMVESANKNVVEARLKGTGMHWQRKNVNPMLALRNAVCNGRWGEMWKKALLHKRSLHTLQRSMRAEKRAQTLLALGNPGSSETPSLQSTASSQDGSPSSFPSQCVAQAESSPTSVLQRPTPSGSSRFSSRRKQRIAHNRTKYSSQRSGERETCICGSPLVQSRGSRRAREYCSNACRQRAYRKRAYYQ
jgi:hypothetical protein